MKKYDIVIWGATGFTGKLCAEYLAAKQLNSFSFAIAGRDLNKLEELSLKLHDIRIKNTNSKEKIPIIVANSNDSESLDQMTIQAKVIITTVGPYMKLGEALLASCVKSKTDYVDLTGELLFIKNAIDKYHKSALDAGVYIVPSCGFDSMPFDIGVFYLANHLNSEHGLKLGSVRTHVINARGGVSGGTLASLSGILSLPKKDLSRMSDPYILCDSSSNISKTDSRASPILQFDSKDTQKWDTYFVMENANTRYVRRSCSLLNYGNSFKYQESFSCSNIFYAVLYTFATFSAFFMIWFSGVRWMMTKLLPPGHGPSLETMKNGFFHIEIYADSEDDQKHYKLSLKCNEDPGYAGTSKMIVDAALVLALDKSKFKSKGGIKPLNGGILTCASAMGVSLVERLQQDGIIDFQLTELKREQR